MNFKEFEVPKVDLRSRCININIYLLFIILILYIAYISLVFIELLWLFFFVQVLANVKDDTGFEFMEEPNRT